MTFTTAFITRCCKKTEHNGTDIFNRLNGLLLHGMLLLLLGFAPPQSAFAEGITVTSASLEQVDEGYRLDAEMDFGLTPTLEDAINKGVPLYFSLDYEVVRPRKYWFDATEVEGAKLWKLSYNALTQQYRLAIGSFYQNFQTLDDARRLLSRQRIIILGNGDKGALKKNTTYKVSVRMRLDVAQLPKPFQVNALGSREWNLSSDWFTFNTTP
ncbi:MAG: DUF4390 domain-containing protein [Burkholderiales bacterium]